MVQAHLHICTTLSVSCNISYLILYLFYFFVIGCFMSTMFNCLHIPLCTVMLILIFNSTAYCHAHSFIFYIFYSLYLIFYSFYFMYTSLVLYFSIFALSMERTRLSFHCWLYNLCIVVYVTNKTWNLKLETDRSFRCNLLEITPVTITCHELNGLCWFCIQSFLAQHLNSLNQCLLLAGSTVQLLWNPPPPPAPPV